MVQPATEFSKLSLFDHPSSFLSPIFGWCSDNTERDSSSQGVPSFGFSAQMTSGQHPGSERDPSTLRILDFASLCLKARLASLGDSRLQVTSSHCSLVLSQGISSGTRVLVKLFLRGGDLGGRGSVISCAVGRFEIHYRQTLSPQININHLCTWHGGFEKNQSIRKSLWYQCSANVWGFNFSVCGFKNSFRPFVLLALLLPPQLDGWDDNSHLHLHIGSLSGSDRVSD